MPDLPVTVSSLKLYVYGPTSGNPDEWPHWRSVQLIAASSQEEAAQIAGCSHYPAGVKEVEMDAAGEILHYVPEEDF